MDAVHNHCWFLSATLSTTKFTLEEVLAAMQDKSRISKHNHISAHKMYFQHAFCTRMMNSKLGQGFLRLQPNDIAHARPNVLPVSSFRGAVPTSSSEVLKQCSVELKKLKGSEGVGLEFCSKG